MPITRSQLFVHFTRFANHPFPIICKLILKAFHGLRYLKYSKGSVGSKTTPHLKQPKLSLTNFPTRIDIGRPHELYENQNTCCWHCWWQRVLWEDCRQKSQFILSSTLQPTLLSTRKTTFLYVDIFNLSHNHSCRNGPKKMAKISFIIMVRNTILKNTRNAGNDELWMWTNISTQLHYISVSSGSWKYRWLMQMSQYKGERSSSWASN